MLPKVILQQFMFNFYKPIFFLLAPSLPFYGACLLGRIICRAKLSFLLLRERVERPALVQNLFA